MFRTTRQSPQSAIGPALNEQGYYVGRVDRNLYWITDGSCQSAFLTTKDRAGTGLALASGPRATQPKRKGDPP